MRSSNRLSRDFPVINLQSKYMLLPGSLVPISLFSRELNEDIKNGRAPFVFAVMSKPGVDFAPNMFYQVGVVAQTSISEDNNGPVVILSGEYRAQALSYRRNKDDDESYWVAQTVPYADAPDSFFRKSGDAFILAPEFEVGLRAVLIKIKKMLSRLIDALIEEGDDQNEVSILDLQEIVDNFENYNLDQKAGLDYFIWHTLNALPDVEPQKKQEILNLQTSMERLGHLAALVFRNLKILMKSNELENRLEERLKEDEEFQDDTQNEPTDRKKMIKTDGDTPFTKDVHPELAQKYARYLEIKPHMNEGSIQSIMESFKRLKTLGKSKGEGSEWNVFMSHIDFMLELPWNTESEQEKNISKVEEALNRDHFGLDFAKVHISRYLAGKLLNPKGRGANLCFIGPPGVGKTSLANSIAGALGRKLIRLSLGGVRDEAEIRGHRKTYVGALAGQVMREIHRGGVKNPIFVLDEIDKITTESRGDPSAALLEVLDPEQNHSFRDHYLDAPFDLSQVLFIATANDASPIRPALLDRLEPVFLPGYTRFEKVQIAKKFLLPKTIAEVGLSEHKIDFNWPDGNPDETIYNIVKGYTKESGVRNLERRLITLGRSLAQEYLKNPEDFRSPEINQDWLVKILGQPRYTEERANKTQAGEVIGLAWTQFGGDILYIQSAILPEFRGKELSQTGSLGKVMQESGKLALSLLRVKLDKEGKIDLLKGKSVHIHVPEGAIEKDGPSAGVTEYCSLYSSAFNKIARPFIAMTGEVTLTGMVTAVGGIKEKVIAAESAGIQEVLLPLSNKRDLDEVPQSAKDKLKFHFIENVEQALKIVFEDGGPDQPAA